MSEFSLPQFTYLKRGELHLTADLAGALWDQTGDWKNILKFLSERQCVFVRCYGV